MCVSVRLSGQTSEGLTHKELQSYVVHQDVIQGNDAQLPKVGGQLQCIYFLFGPEKKQNRQGFRSTHIEEGKRFYILGHSAAAFIQSVLQQFIHTPTVESTMQSDS